MVAIRCQVLSEGRSDYPSAAGTWSHVDNRSISNNLFDNGISLYSNLIVEMLVAPLTARSSYLTAWSH